MVFIISTMAADVSYTLYRRSGEGRELRHSAVKNILIRGGQGVLRKGDIYAPDNGIVTEIADDDYAVLKDNPVFKSHMDKGFIRVVDTDNKRTVAKVVENEMSPEDDSAQLTAADFASDAANLKDGETLKIDGKTVAPGKKRSKKRK